ncbi:MAG: dihydrofolate reductase [Pseudomonadota bacterium]
MSSIALIYARSRNRYIGAAGKVPWSLPDEYDIFERETLGHAVIMGRRTYDDHQYAFPSRLNIVVTRNPSYPLAKGVKRSPSLSAAIALADGYSSTTFVIGGPGLLEEAFPMSDRVFETIVDADICGDARLAAFDFDEWQTKVTQQHPVDAKHAHAFTAYVHSRAG